MDRKAPLLRTSTESPSCAEEEATVSSSPPVFYVIIGLLSSGPAAFSTPKCPFNMKLCFEIGICLVAAFQPTVPTSCLRRGYS